MHKKEEIIQTYWNGREIKSIKPNDYKKCVNTPHKYLKSNIKVEVAVSSFNMQEHNLCIT